MIVQYCVRAYNQKFRNGIEPLHLIAEAVLTQVRIGSQGSWASSVHARSRAGGGSSFFGRPLAQRDDAYLAADVGVKIFQLSF